MKLYQLVRQARRLAPHVMPKVQKAVLTCIIEHSNSNGDGTGAYPSVEEIALQSSCSERHAQRCIKWLEAEGWIVVTYRKGGHHKPSGYSVNLDQFGNLVARPPAPAEPQEVEPARRLIFARGVLRRLKPDSPARDRWEQEVQELEAELGEQPAETLPTVSPAAAALVPFMVGNDLEQLLAMYSGWILLQAREPPDSDRYQWYQERIDQARKVLNRECHFHGVVAPDGLEPVVSQELQEQMQAWSHKIEQYTNYRDGLTPGSRGWQRWDDEAKKATKMLNSFLYHPG